MKKQPKLTLKEEFFSIHTTISDNGSIIFKGTPLEVFEFFSPHLKKKEKKYNVEIPEENIIRFNEMFPRIKGGSGKFLRCNTQELRKAFEWFFKNYDQYVHAWDLIYDAVEQYIIDQEKENFKFCRTAKYFILKFKTPNMPESTLLEYLHHILEGDSSEGEVKPFDIKIY